MRKMKKINGFLVVRFNDREKRVYPELGSFGVIDAEQYVGDIDLDLDAMEYTDAETIEIAVEQARGLNNEEDYTDQPTTYAVITETAMVSREEEVNPQLLIKGWERQLEDHIKSSHFKDVDPRTAVHEFYGYKVALCDLGLLDREDQGVDPDHFAPGMTEQPLPKDSEELLAHICDQVCKHPNCAESQKKLDSVCAECVVGRLVNEAEDRGLRVVEKAKARLDKLILALAESQRNAKAEHFEHEARAYLEALSTTKTLAERQVAAYEAAISEAIKGRPEPPERKTFENIYPELKNSRVVKNVYVLGLALAEKCPDNDCQIYRNIFNAARDLDAALDEVDSTSAPGLALRRSLAERIEELRDMYLTNYAVQQYKEGMKA